MAIETRSYIAKGRLLKMPPYDSSGGSYDWKGVLVRRNVATQLPIAHLAGRIINTGGTVFNVGYYANRPEFVTRRPNVLLCSEERYDRIKNNPKFQELSDKHGIITAILSNTPEIKAPWDGGLGGLIYGLPLTASGDPRPLGSYIGGRLLVIHDQRGVMLWYVHTGTEMVPTKVLARPHSGPPCPDIEIPDSVVLKGILVDHEEPRYYIIELYHSALKEAVKFVSQAAKYFDRLAIIIDSTPESPIEEWLVPPFTCFEGFHPADFTGHAPIEGLAQSVFSGVPDNWPGPTVKTDNSAWTNFINPITNQLALSAQSNEIIYKSCPLNDVTDIEWFFDT